MQRFVHFDRFAVLPKRENSGSGRMWSVHAS
jgi:hypothetical protein